MPAPRVRVIHCHVDRLETELEPLVDGYAIVQSYYYPRDGELWAVMVLGKLQHHIQMQLPPGNNFRPR